MLRSLDSIPWDRLTHAYGAAGDVPDLIRQLQHKDPAQRGQALGMLYGNIWHQGTVFEATAHAVPFLRELLRESAVPDRHEIIILLAHLATGDSFLDVHRHFTWAKLTEKPDFEERLALELSWVRAARGAVRDGYPEYHALLVDPDPKVRGASAYLLALFATEVEDTGALLRQRFEAGEPNEMVQVALISLAGGSAAKDPAIASWLRDLLRSEAASEPVRIAAALGLVRVPPDATTPVVRTLLTKALRGMPAAAEIFAALPWPDTDLREYAAAALSHLGQSNSTADPAVSGAGVEQETLDALVSALNAATPMQSWAIAHSMLSLVFGSSPRDPAKPFAELTADQQFALRAVADAESFWTGSKWNVVIGPVTEVLEAHGLPTRRAELERFVGSQRAEPAAPTSSTPAHKPWWRFW